MKTKKIVLLVVMISACLTGYLYAKQDDYLENAKELYEAKKYDEAITEFTKSIEVSPESSESYWWRGLAHHVIKNYDAAISDLSKYLTLDPKSSKGFGARGNVYADKGEFDLAIVDFNKSLEFTPTAYGLNCNLSKAYLGKKDFDSAYEYAARCGCPEMFEVINKVSGKNVKFEVRKAEVAK